MLTSKHTHKHTHALPCICPCASARGARATHRSFLPPNMQELSAHRQTQTQTHPHTHTYAADGRSTLLATPLEELLKFRGLHITRSEFEDAWHSVPLGSHLRTHTHTHTRAHTHTHMAHTHTHTPTQRTVAARFSRHLWRSCSSSGGCTSRGPSLRTRGTAYLWGRTLPWPRHAVRTR